MKTLYTSLVILFFSGLVSIAQEPTLLESKKHRFTWPLPATWEQAKPLTSAQYAVVLKGSKSTYNCSILVSPKRFSIEDLIKDQKKNPRVYFDNAVLPRFPDSKFIGSSISKLGSRDALLSEYVYTAKNLDQVFSFHAFTLVTVWKENFYIMTFECPKDEAVTGRKLLQQLIIGFSFSE